MRDERAAAAVQAVPDDVRFTTFHVVLPDGSGLSGGSAVIGTLSAIAWTSWLGRALSLPILRFLVGWSYRGVVASKGFLGRFVPDRPGPDRWP